MSSLQVGSFLMSSLRKWIEKHEVPFPLPRSALMVEEADRLADIAPEAACSLLMAASDSKEASDDVR